jgi:hypothetical protein
MVREWHTEPVQSRYAKPITDPADALLSFENFERYRQQSAATRNNEVAQLPARAPLTRELDPA